MSSMGYTVRKFKKVLQTGTAQDVEEFIKNKDAFFDYIFRFIHDTKILKLYKEKVGFSSVNKMCHWDILLSCRYEKGIFLVKNGFDPHIVDTFTGENILKWIKDFRFFKYLVEEEKVKIDSQSIIESQSDLRIIKYILDKGYKIESVSYTNGLEKTKLLHQCGVKFSKGCRERTMCRETLNYLYDITDSNEEKFDFLDNNNVTCYILNRLIRESETDDRIKNLVFEKIRSQYHSLNCFLNIDVLLFAHKEGIINIFDCSDDFNILGKAKRIKTIADMKKLFKDMSSEAIKKLLNEKNEKGESFLWTKEAIRGFSVKDMEYLIEKGLEYDFLNTEGQSFLEKTMVDLKVKQFFLEKKVPVSSISKTAGLDTCGIELNNLNDYIDYSLHYNFCLPEKMINFLGRESSNMTLKNVKKIFENPKTGVKEKFIKDYSLIKGMSLSKKTIRYLIKNIPSVNNKDDSGAFLIYYCSPEYINLFIKEGLNVMLLPDDIEKFRKYMRKHEAMALFEKIVEAKVHNENQTLKALLTSDSSVKKKRI